MEPTHQAEGADSAPAPPRSLEQLFRALETPLLAYAMRLTHQAETAQDCVQEAFVRLHPRLAAGEVREPRAWLYRTVHNLALTTHRAARRLVPLDAGVPSDQPQSRQQQLEKDLALADPAPLPDAELERHETAGFARLVLARLERLDPRAAEIVRLKFKHNLSYKDIAERTGLGVGHVGYILHHTLRALANELTRAGFGN